MIDTRAVAQEVQDQLTAAMHKGQEQIRKGRESVTVAVRTGGQIAQAVKPSLPKLPAVPVKLPRLARSPARISSAPTRELASQMLATQRKLTDQALASQRRLAGHAQDLADQALATQRKLGDRALEVAGPFISDGVTRLAHAAGPSFPAAGPSAVTTLSRSTTRPSQTGRDPGEGEVRAEGGQRRQGQPEAAYDQGRGGEARGQDRHREGEPEAAHDQGRGCRQDRHR